jgi:hypothetical protein
MEIIIAAIILSIVVALAVAGFIFKDKILAFFQKECPECEKEIEQPPCAIPKIDQCADGSCTEKTEKPKFSGTIKLSLIPDNGRSKVIPGSISTKTYSLKAVEEITGDACPECVVRKWYDNGTELIQANGLNYLSQSLYKFTAGHTIVYRVVIDDVSEAVSARIL